MGLQQTKCDHSSLRNVQCGPCGTPALAINASRIAELERERAIDPEKWGWEIARRYAGTGGFNRAEEAKWIAAELRRLIEESRSR